MILEQAILFTVMEQARRFAPVLLENITDESLFTDRNCRIIFKAIRKLYQNKQIPYLADVMIETSGMIKPQYFSSMSQYTQGIQPGGYEKFLLDSIEKFIWLRKRKEIIQTIYREVEGHIDNPKQIIELANQLKVSSKLKEKADIETADQEYKEWITRKDGITSGFPTLDNLTDGFNLGELVVICGRPTTAKTMMALNMIQHIQSHALKRMAMFSIEMPKSAVIERMKQIYMGLSRGELKTATETKTDQSEEFLEFYKDFKIYTKSYSVSQMKQIIEDEGIEIVFIDFLNIVKAEIIGKRYERTTQIISDIKNMTKDLNILTVIMAQLSRLAGDGSFPVSLDMLRDSGSIEEVGDFIIGLCRPEIDENSKKEWSNMVLGLILKNKRGRAGRMKLYLEPNTGNLKEVQDE